MVCRAAERLLDSAEFDVDVERSEDRVPLTRESKEATIERYREGLEYHGVATDEWWERQLDLCLVGIMATFGWEKAVGDAEELAWWDERVARAKRWLD